MSTEEFTISVGTTASRADCTRHKTTWQKLSAALLKPKQSAKKDGQWIVEGTFRGNRRAAANIERRHCMTFDIDGGYSEEEARAAAQGLECECVVHSTYSHGTCRTEASAKKYDKWVAENPRDNPAEAYLVEEKGMLEKIAAGAVEAERTEDNVVLLHPPCRKWRVVVWLAEPFDFTRPGAVERWTTLYNAVGQRLGIAFDTACGDAPRLFYTNRHPLEPMLPPQAWRAPGPPLDLAKIKIEEIAPAAVEDTPRWTPDISKPGDRFSTARPGLAETVLSILVAEGWETSRLNAEQYQLTRPGKSPSKGISSTLRRDNAVFHVFTDDASPFKPNHSYSAFQVKALLEHDGDFNAAAAAIRRDEVQFKREGASPLETEGIGGITAMDLMHKKIAPIHFTVEGMLPEGLAVLGGKPKIGKSFFALQLCLAVATGDEFLCFQATAGKAVYLALEDGEKRLQNRLEQMLKGCDAPTGLTFFNKWKPLDRGGHEDIEALLSADPEIRLLVIDTWQKLRPIQKPRGATAYEVDYAEASKLKALADAYHCAILLIHHLRKAAPGAASGGDVFERITGSTGITGAADCIGVLDRYRNVGDAELHLSGRDIEEGVHLLARDKETAGWTRLGGAEQVAHTPEQQKLLNALSEMDSAAPAELASVTGFDVQYIRNTLPRLLKRGFVKKVKYGVYAAASFFEERSDDETLR